MTAKNRIILSVIAIITTLVVAGSMIFIIFAATRGSVSGGITIGYTKNDTLLSGSVTTRYTTKEISAFGNGEGDVLVKTTDGEEAIEFVGWHSSDDSKTLENIDITLSLENPWVIFELDCVDMVTTWITLSIDDEADYENVDIIFYGKPYDESHNAITLSSIKPESFEGVYYEYDAAAITPVGAFNNIAQSTSHSCTLWMSGGQKLYYMIKVRDTSQDAYFSGALNCEFSAYFA